MSNQRKMRGTSLTLASLAAVPLSQATTANELFLVPDKSVISIRSRPLIRLADEAFVRSYPAIERASLLDVSVAGDGRVTDLSDRAWYDDADCIDTTISTLCGPPTGPISRSPTVSILKYRVGDAGTYVVDVSERPQIVTITADELAAHLRQSGAPGAVEASERAQSAHPIRERQSRFARAIVQVLDESSSDYARVFDHAVEIVLDQNPYDRAVGDPLAFRVLRDGRPAVKQLATVGYRDEQTPPHRVDVYELRTDEAGRSSFVLTAAGLWYVSVADVRKSADTEADCDATWSTVTFRTK